MREFLKALLASLLVGALLMAPIAWMIYQWEECRSYGFGILYCLKHVF